MKSRGLREKRWVVRPGDGQTVASILEQAGEHLCAVDEGRVFVGRRRVVRSAEAVKIGDEIRIGAPAPKTGADIQVLFERDGLLACSKPAGIPTVPDHTGASQSLVALAASRRGKTLGDLRVTSRLDREVSGVVVFALTPEAEERLKNAREKGCYTRRYVALAQDSLPAEVDTSSPVCVWSAPIGRGKDPRHRAPHGPDAKASVTHWRIIARAGGFVLLAIEPQTGRTHQIRVHASHAGAPLLGDRDYGGAARAVLSDGRVVTLSRIALHAARVTVPDAHGKPLVADAPVPSELLSAWTELGGAPEAWDRAVSCSLVV